jgi:hypothetical protein
MIVISTKLVDAWSGASLPGYPAEIGTGDHYYRLTTRFDSDG